MVITPIPNQPMTSTDIIANLAARLHALEQLAITKWDADKLHDKTLDVHLDMIEDLKSRVTRLEKAMTGEWVHPVIKLDYVDVTEGADEISGGEEG